MTTFDSTADGIIIYGPPRARRKRLLNRARRLLGMDERDEAYYVGWPKVEPGDFAICWNAAGIFTLAPPRDADPELGERVGD